MAKLQTNMTLNLDIEPTERAKEMIRAIVVDLLKEIMQSAQLEERITTLAQKAVEQAMQTYDNEEGNVC